MGYPVGQAISDGFVIVMGDADEGQQSGTNLSAALGTIAGDDVHRRPQYSLHHRPHAPSLP
jgi:hypothetical protein